MSLITTQDQSFRLVLHETLLDGLERTGHEVEYQCRSGYCGMCRVKLLHGDVRYLEPPLAFVAYDEVLPCCCVPIADITVDCRLLAKFKASQLIQDIFSPQGLLFSDDDLIPKSQQKTGIKKRSRSVRRKGDKSRNLELF
ncbi:MAG: class I ribonucleotide reductase maintenance protein YfaE [Methylophilaceae bacterium]